MDPFEVAFAPLFARSYRAASRLLGDRTDAEDIAAEALSRAYTSWWRLRDHEHAEAWVLRVTTNLAIDVLRRRGRARTQPPVVAHADDRAELRLVLVPLLHRLPKRQREVVGLRLLVDLSERETATVLGISQGSVKQHLHRAVGALRLTLPPETMEEVFA